MSTATAPQRFLGALAFVVLLLLSQAGHEGNTVNPITNNVYNQFTGASLQTRVFRVASVKLTLTSAATYKTLAEFQADTAAAIEGKIGFCNSPLSLPRVNCNVEIKVPNSLTAWPPAASADVPVEFHVVNCDSSPLAASKQTQVQAALGAGTAIHSGHTVRSFDAAGTIKRPASLVCPRYDELNRILYCSGRLNQMVSTYGDTLDNFRQGSTLPGARVMDLYFPDDVEHIYMQNGDITEIPADAFAHLTKLKHLYLGHNKVQSLPATLFQDLTELITLEIEHNELASFAGTSLRNCLKLEFLDLSFNWMTTWDETTLDGLKWIKYVNIESNKFPASTTTFKWPTIDTLVGDHIYPRVCGLGSWKECRIINPTA